MPLVQHPMAGLAYCRERLREQRLENLPSVVALPELSGLTAQFLVAHRDEVVLNRVHLFGDIAELLEKFALAYA